METNVWGLARIMLKTPRSTIEHAIDCATRAGKEIIETVQVRFLLR